MDNKLDLILKKLEILDELKESIQQIDARTKSEFQVLNAKVDKITLEMEKHHISSINADTILLNEVRSIREGVVYVNRKVADAELELNMIKQTHKQ